ncbi:MAG: hypothetical protein LBQ67_06380 [Treponema sp.]|jgi:hypothetical protein|nr:hypothetical protein [Treponema sp.]
MNIFEKLKMKLISIRYGDLLPSEKFIRDYQKKQNRPTAVSLKRAMQKYRETKDDKYNTEAVVILTRFRVILSDFRFDKLLRENNITKKSAIEAMASYLNFTPEGDTDE